MNDILVIYYSRSGYTRRVAQDIAQKLACDIGEIRDVRSRNSVFGYLRSGYEALHQKTPAIKAVEKDPAQYARVILGTPMWAGNMAAPVRTYITENRDRFGEMAFFCTCGGSDTEKLIKQMSALCGKDPIASLSLKDNEITGDSYQEKLGGFISRLQPESVTS